jgi:nitric oxide synthase oxygenase domain/subunit
MQSAKEQFHAIRRMYRASLRVSAVHANGEQVVRARVAAVSAMRKFTGKWDTCEPVPVRRTYRYIHRGYNRRSVNRQFVAAACTRWLAAH